MTDVYTLKRTEIRRKKRKLQDFCKSGQQKNDLGTSKLVLLVATHWSNSGVIPKLPTTDGIIDLFLDLGATKEKISYHCGLIWSEEDVARIQSSKLAGTVLKLVNSNQYN